MIFLKECNLLFLKPMKVAGTSFEISLSKFGMKHDVITPISPDDEKIRATLGFAGPRNYRKPLWEWDAKDIYTTIRQKTLPIKYFNHISAVAARKKLGSQVFDQAFKVSIVRNPYDMLASFYFWEMKRRKNKLPFLYWAQQNSHLFNINDKQYFIKSQNIIHFFIRFEHIVDDSANLEILRPEIKGLSTNINSVRAKSGVRPIDTTYSQLFCSEPDIISAVRFFNQELIKKFDYKFT